MEEDNNTDSWIIYTKEGCPFCVKAKNLLKLYKQNYMIIEIDPIDGKRVFNGMKDKIGDYQYFPVIFFNDKFIGGYSQLTLLLPKQREELKIFENKSVRLQICSGKSEKDFCEEIKTISDRKQITSNINFDKINPSVIYGGMLHICSLFKDNSAIVSPSNNPKFNIKFWINNQMTFNQKLKNLLYQDYFWDIIKSFLSEKGKGEGKKRFLFFPFEYIRKKEIYEKVEKDYLDLNLKEKNKLFHGLDKYAISSSPKVTKIEYPTFSKGEQFIKIINMYIYDTKTKSLERFNPEGSKLPQNMTKKERFDSELDKEFDKIDNYIVKIFTKNLGEKFIKIFYPPLMGCPSVDFKFLNEYSKLNFNNNDTTGYCNCWNYWYLYNRLKTPDLDRGTVKESSLKKFLEIDNDFKTFFSKYTEKIGTFSKGIINTNYFDEISI
jgi:glutaredoxin